MLCKHCGYELPETAKFCRSCGKPQLAEVLKISSESPVVNADSTVMVKAPAKAEAESVKVLKSRAKASVETEAESVKAPRSRAKAAANAEVEPVKAPRSRAKVAVNAEAEPVKAPRSKAKAAANAEVESVKAPRSRAKAEAEPVNAAKENSKVPVQENSEATIALIATPQTVSSTSTVKSKKFAYSLIASGLVAFVCIAGYWGWTQRAIPEEHKTLNSTSNVEEERLRKEAEDKLRLNVEEEKAQQKVQAEQARKDAKERDVKVAVQVDEKKLHTQWTGRYQCSELLFPGVRTRKEFAVDIDFTTKSGKGFFIRRNSEIVEKFFISIDGTRVEINSEGNRNEDPTKKWFVKTTGTLTGKTIDTSGSMFGADGKQVIRQNCKIQAGQ